MSATCTTLIGNAISRMPRPVARPISIVITAGTWLIAKTQIFRPHWVFGHADEEPPRFRLDGSLPGTRGMPYR